ncbi:hypothetical protein SAY87_013087 [Trapa incisa]|uniref:F-box domain-containing protein n=1 Tax=Trapa incisa TaxID=236973 RepID=A0AAN7KEK3_9MYRT|nr:hypothetical protein SAY87_013087 [Trapa incisa]
MPGFNAGKKRCSAAVAFCVSDSEQRPITAKRNASDYFADVHVPILPGLPDDVAKACLALVPRSDIPSMAAVCKKWRSFIRSREFLITRELAGAIEEWIYLLVADEEGKEWHWEVLDSSGNKQKQPPTMPCPAKAGFEVVALDAKLFIAGGYSVDNGTKSASSDVYEYDCCLNSWRKLASMNTARYDFACAEVNGRIYAVGGYGVEGESLFSAEFYSPETDKWTLMEPSLRRPRTGSFGFGFDNKLYIMGGRSSFTIGNSRSIDIYDTERHEWSEMRKGCVMVTSHSVVGKKLFCLAWKDPRKLAVFDPGDATWKEVAIPLTGSSSIGFKLGSLGGKLVLFSHEKASWYGTLVYDPEAAKGSEWQTSTMRPLGECLLSVTMVA